MFEAKDADDILLIPRVAGHVINFGDASGLERKRRALMAIYRNVMPYKGWEEYDTISVKFRGQVVATRRDKSAAAHSAVLTEEADLEEASLAAHSGAVRADIGAANDSTQSVNENENENEHNEQRTIHSRTGNQQFQDNRSRGPRPPGRPDRRRSP